MIIQIMGVDEKLKMTEGISLLNIHNKLLYRSIINFFIYSLEDEEKNEVVIFDDKENRIKPSKVLFINDIIEFKFDTNQIVNKLIKPFVISTIETEIEQKEKETRLYQQIIQPVIDYATLMDVDFDYKEELDINFYLKLIGFDYSINNEQPIVDKIIYLIRIYIRVKNSQIIIINRALVYLTDEELDKIESFSRKNGIIILFIDYLDDSEVVIANNMVVAQDFGAYSLK